MRPLARAGPPPEVANQLDFLYRVLPPGAAAGIHRRWTQKGVVDVADGAPTRLCKSELTWEPPEERVGRLGRSP